MLQTSGQSYKTFYARKLRLQIHNIDIFLVQYDSRVVICEHKLFIRLNTACCWLYCSWSTYSQHQQKFAPFKISFSSVAGFFTIVKMSKIYFCCNSILWKASSNFAAERDLEVSNATFLLRQTKLFEANCISNRLTFVSTFFSLDVRILGMVSHGTPKVGYLDKSFQNSNINYYGKTNACLLPIKCDQIVQLLKILGDHF